MITEGRTSETRIVVDRILDSSMGGKILYRIDAHLTYRIDGQTQDRWLTASGTDASRELLALKLANHPKTCQVYWRTGHPESAKCRLP
jgi:hypothetical protein